MKLFSHRGFTVTRIGGDAICAIKIRITQQVFGAVRSTFQEILPSARPTQKMAIAAQNARAMKFWLRRISRAYGEPPFPFVDNPIGRSNLIMQRNVRAAHQTRSIVPFTRFIRREARAPDIARLGGCLGRISISSEIAPNRNTLVTFRKGDAQTIIGEGVARICL